jgi:hypothetical protein
MAARKKVDLGATKDELVEAGRVLIDKADEGFVVREIVNEVFAENTASAEGLQLLAEDGLYLALRGYVAQGHQELDGTSEVVARRVRSGRTATTRRRSATVLEYRALSVTYFSVTQGRLVPLLAFTVADCDAAIAAFDRKAAGMVAKRDLFQKTAETLRKARVHEVGQLGQRKLVALNRLWSGVVQEEE